MRLYYKTPDGKIVTDVDPQASELWAAIGDKPLTMPTYLIDTYGLPEGYRWLSDDEWEAMQATLEPLEARREQQNFERPG